MTDYSKRKRDALEFIEESIKAGVDENIIEYECLKRFGISRLFVYNTKKLLERAGKIRLDRMTFKYVWIEQAPNEEGKNPIVTAKKTL